MRALSRLLLRALMALDGSTTRVCEAIAQAPMTVQLLSQQQTDSVPAAVRESLGGWVASWLAAHHPDRVERVVLNTAGGSRAEQSQIARDDLATYEQCRLALDELNAGQTAALARRGLGPHVGPPAAGRRVPAGVAEPAA